MNGLTIGSLAKQAGVGIDTVRFYERSGLLPRPLRSASGYRLYKTQDAERLIFIRRAKTLGFSLEEVTELLRLNSAKGSRGSVKALAQHRLADLDRRIQEMTSIRDALALLVRKCSGKGPVDGCPIIEGVVGGQAAHCEGC